ncbi:MAG TPA: glycerol-3-phosphate 1-O-acyltransferase PlsY [Thermoanaerobaculia bacterium]
MSPSTIGIVVGAYLLGSIAFSVVVVKLVLGLDVRTVGSGNAGATNALRAAGKKAGAAVLFLDLLKGVTAVAVPRALGVPPAVVGGAALAVVLGHVFPIFFGFRGGKGVAASAGALGALSPVAMLLALLVFAAVVGWKRYVSLGSMAAAGSFPFLAMLVHRLGWTGFGGRWLLLSSGAISLIILAKHTRNYQRLRKGTEPRLGERRAGPAEGMG